MQDSEFNDEDGGAPAKRSNLGAMAGASRLENMKRSLFGGLHDGAKTLSLLR